MATLCVCVSAHALQGGGGPFLTDEGNGIQRFIQVAGAGGLSLLVQAPHLHLPPCVVGQPADCIRHGGLCPFLVDSQDVGRVAEGVAALPRMWFLPEDNPPGLAWTPPIHLALGLLVVDLENTRPLLFLTGSRAGGRPEADLPPGPIPSSRLHAFCPPSALGLLACLAPTGTFPSSSLVVR